jgi:two-component system OmpR family response regulator
MSKVALACMGVGRAFVYTEAGVFMPAKSPMQTTILLLSSEPLVRVVIQEFLERAGYLVMATGDLGTAVDRIGEATPDLLIISPYVETITGHQAAKYLQSRCQSMRILMVAGMLADDRLQYRAELDKVEIFPQPFTGLQLLDKVEAILSEPSGA